MRLIVPVLSVVGLLAACGDDGAVDVGGPTTTASDADQRYEASAFVLENEKHGPQLCLGSVQDSLPPGCGGPDLPGWVAAT